MDHNTEGAGDKLATEIFTPDGVLNTSASVARGEAGWLHFQLIVLILNLMAWSMLKSVSLQDE